MLDADGLILSAVAPGTCTWKYKAPVGQKALITCNIFNIPPAGACAGDHVLMDGKKFCGTSFKPLLSTSNTLEVKLNAMGKGSLTCTITAVSDPCDCGRRISVRNTEKSHATIYHNVIKYLVDAHRQWNKRTSS